MFVFLVIYTGGELLQDCFYAKLCHTRTVKKCSWVMYLDVLHTFLDSVFYINVCVGEAVIFVRQGIQGGFTYVTGFRLGDTTCEM